MEKKIIILIFIYFICVIINCSSCYNFENDNIVNENEIQLTEPTCVNQDNDKFKEQSRRLAKNTYPTICNFVYVCYPFSKDSTLIDGWEKVSESNIFVLSKKIDLGTAPFRLYDSTNVVVKIKEDEYDGNNILINEGFVETKINFGIGILDKQGNDTGNSLPENTYIKTNYISNTDRYSKGEERLKIQFASLLFRSEYYGKAFLCIKEWENLDETTNEIINYVKYYYSDDKYGEIKKENWPNGDIKLEDIMN